MNPKFPSPIAGEVWQEKDQPALTGIEWKRVAAGDACLYGI